MHEAQGTAPGLDSPEAHAERLLEAAGALRKPMDAKRGPTPSEVVEAMNASFGAGRSRRRWNPRDADEAIEIALVLTLLGAGRDHYAQAASEWCALDAIEAMAKHAPVHNARTEEQRHHQHFSTPAGVALVMAEAAQAERGDRALEPSAGTGMLVAAASMRTPDLDWHVNEIEPVRHEVLKRLFPDATHTALDAVELARTHPRDTFDTVLMNPPFTRSATSARRRLGEDLHHVGAGARMLAPGGRLVAVTGKDAHPHCTLWNTRVDTDSTMTALWSKRLGRAIYTNSRNLALEVRMTVLERHSVHTSRPWSERHDETLSCAGEAMGSVLTELATRHREPRQ